ncbi:type IV pilus modification protein PilV [Herbaspirillum rhizosphaerae]|uniref:type IV pilus modification protein PilV n=1 Tax=Herbaspirillum rhizosphaerae TaxID=346179 RepID=UPI0009F936A0|nr:type IV pilus modification protein PilV [Herbaspirillum rhizosphaerae]
MRFHVNEVRRQSPQHGFTLIEVLVAIVILTLGASGVAAMQLHALRMAQQSGFQTAATQLAVTLAELMRANPALARSGSSPYLFAYDASASSATTSASCLQHACDSVAMAAVEVQGWQQQLQQALPRARAVVCRDGKPATADRLQWSCDHAGDAAIVIKIGWSAREASPSADTLVPAESAPMIAVAVAI